MDMTIQQTGNKRFPDLNISRIIFTGLLAAVLAILPFTTADERSIWAAMTAPAMAAQTYKRADFNVEGTSCAACLIRIEKKLKKLPGVARATVSIYRPYSAIVIYDPNKTSFEKVKAVLEGEKARAAGISFENVHSLPIILLPRRAS